jgi:hypothetical protein
MKHRKKRTYANCKRIATILSKNPSVHHCLIHVVTHAGRHWHDKRIQFKELSLK